MSPLATWALGVVFGVCAAGFLAGLVACAAEWRAAWREGGES